MMWFSGSRMMPRSLFKYVIMLALIVVGAAFFFDSRDGALFVSRERERLSAAVQGAQVCQSMPPGRINVKRFGALGDAYTDDTDALQAAADCVVQKLNAGAAAELYLPTGDYRTTSAIVIKNGRVWDKLVILGDGQHITFIGARRAGQGIFDIRLTAQIPVQIGDVSLEAHVAGAGTAVYVSMPASENATPSLEMRNMFIRGRLHGETEYFTYGLRGIGLTKPLLHNVDFKAADRNNHIIYGAACARITDGYGFSASGKTRCAGMRLGLDMSQRGGAVYLHGGGFGSGAETSVRVDAGRGSVHIDGSHVNPRAAAGVPSFGYDISNAGSVLIENVLTLIQDETTVQEAAIVRVRNSNDVVIRNNKFRSNQGLSNPNRTTVLIGEGNANVLVENNIFHEAAAVGVHVAQGVVGTQIRDNRFIKTRLDIRDFGSQTQILLLPSENTASSAVDPQSSEDDEPEESSTGSSAESASGPVKTASIPGCPEQDGTFNVRDYGANGTDALDDTAAFERAMRCLERFYSASSDRGGAVLYIPTGTYNVTKKLIMENANREAKKGGGIVIRGDGPKASFVRTNGDGIFDITIGVPAPIELVSLDVRDIGFVAMRPAAGAAVRVMPSRPRGLVVEMHNVDIQGLGPADYFEYGLETTGTSRSVLDYVHMKSLGATMCFSLGSSYGYIMQDSSCDGAEIGIDTSVTSEGNKVEDSVFTNVDTAIRMRDEGDTLVSASGGMIAGNTISARLSGVDINHKRGVSIVGNRFTSIADTATYRDVVLTDVNQVIVDNNTFTGGGINRKAVVLVDDTSSRAPALMTTISNNTFGALGTGISVGAGAQSTVIIDNSFNGTLQPVSDRGVGTFIRYGSAATRPGNSAGTSCALVRTLMRGSTGADVTCLQRHFIAQSTLPSDAATGYYGPLTERAVQIWQCEKGIVCSGSSSVNGYGVVGPRTRESLNASMLSR